MKKKVNNILSAVWKIYLGILFIVTLTILYPLFYYFLKKEKRYVYCFKLQRFWALTLQVFGGVILVIDRKGGLPNPPYIICSNHSSYFDIILMYQLFSDYFVFLSKQELNNWPLFNIFFKSMNISVDRKSRMGSHKAFVRAANELDKGRSIAFFPEGTIPPHAPKLKRFKNGAFKLAIEKQIPIVPVVYTNNWKLIQGTKLFKGKAGPGISKAVIHPPIDTHGMTSEDIVPLRDKVFQLIKKTLMEHGLEQDR